MNKPSSTAQLIKHVRGSNDDHEWYPTTELIIRLVKQDLDKKFHDSFSMLDCGAGDGRVLNALCTGKKYAIEKSRPLLDAMDRDIFIVGTEFNEQNLIDKRVDTLFVNPPFSSYAHWCERIIREANCGYIYMVVPKRWSENQSIKEALALREAKVVVLGSTDFLHGDRAARVDVDVLMVDLVGRRYSGSDTRPRTDPFRVWFNESFTLNLAAETSVDYAHKHAIKADIKEKINNEVVNGRDLINALKQLYDRDMEKLIALYQSLVDIDPALLKEMDINIKGVCGSLQAKIENLKDLYWQELFDNLDRITGRLTAQSRKAMLDTLTSHTHVDFTPANAYAVVGWAVRNANVYFNEQLIKIVERMTEKASITLYKSNQNTFGEDAWRYCSTPRDLDRYKLDYRIVLYRVGGICNSEYSFENTKWGLTERATEFVNDLLVIAGNLGFDTNNMPRVQDFNWDSRIKNRFTYKDHRTGKEAELMTVTAFKNGNLHIQFNQAFICQLNVEFGRLKGWLKSSSEAAEELDITPQQAQQSFKCNFLLKGNDLPMLAQLAA